ncbi:alpha/beta hydrolase [Rhodococcus sp. HM1]|uniref:alpha/beta fold hydrolase n=1 Tax=Rhodococcus sp. HM1 TaxID=2937759 RepID=UPI00200A4386|nr:alpha/beta hydrolase [Rhodococcus sp. HM1]MCK8672641.1 alpha/beta hydrolase [Rhodococcus sp. HM1]
MAVLRRALVAALMGGVLVCSCGTDTQAEDAVASGDVAGRVDIGDGHHLYLDCRGTGSPTVVLQSGFGNAGDIWSLSESDSPAVQPALATSTRVCSYDRPGSLVTTTVRDGEVVDAEEPSPGRSDEVPMPRDPAEVVAELHDLLTAAGETGPYVLVGHSLGGPLQALYAATYPSEVAGIVLVDAPMPELRDSVTADQWNLMAHPQLTPGSYPDGYTAETYSLDQLMDEIGTAPPLPPVPMEVLVRGEDTPLPDPLPPGMSAADLEALHGAEPQAQTDFVASQPDAELVVVPGTTHYIQTQRPDAVVDAVNRVRDRADG